MALQAIAFYLMSAVTLVAGFCVVSARNPVHSVLWLILAFFSAAGLFVLLGAEVLAMLLVLITSWGFRRFTPRAVDATFRKLQLVSAAAYSLGHGGNDAQKTMGIIAVLLYSQGMLSGGFHVPLWVVLACQAAMALGTLFGGWRIVHTMGSKITRLTPHQGFCAETGGAITVLLASSLGVPVSTTHTITGAIVGVGASRRLAAVRWGVAGRIVWAWVLTIPCSALVAAIVFWLIG